jgi:hypothetical protein
VDTDKRWKTINSGGINTTDRFTYTDISTSSPTAPFGRRRTTLGPVLAAVVIALHSIEYTVVGQQIARVDAAIDATVPADTSVLHLVVPSRYGCDKSAGPVTGVPVLKWFAVDHALEAGPARVKRRGDLACPRPRLGHTRHHRSRARRL